MRASDKTRQAATNLEDTSKGLVFPSQTGERIRPSHGGLVQYCSPKGVGRSGSISSASSLSNLSSNLSPPASACSQFRRCQRQIRKAGNASTRKASFSWRSGWHPGRKDEDHANWRGGLPGSERIPKWRAHTRPVDRVVELSAPSISDPSMSFGIGRSHPSPEPEEQPFWDATSARGIESSFFVGCQQIMPESPEPFQSTIWDRFPRMVEPPPYESTLRYGLE